MKPAVCPPGDPHDPYPVPSGAALLMMPPGATVASSGGFVGSSGEESIIQAPTAGCSSVAWADTPGAAAIVASSRAIRTMVVEVRRRIGLTPLLSPMGAIPRALSRLESPRLDGGRDHRDHLRVHPRVILTGMPCSSCPCTTPSAHGHSVR